MSWFNLGVSQEELEIQEAEFKKRYGIVSVKTEDDYTLPITQDHDYDEEQDVTNLDDNKDEKYDYSDLED